MYGKLILLIHPRCTVYKLSFVVGVRKSFLEHSTHCTRVVGRVPVYGVFGAVAVARTSFLFVKCVRSLGEQAERIKTSALTWRDTILSRYRVRGKLGPVFKVSVNC